MFSSFSSKPFNPPSFHDCPASVHYDLNASKINTHYTVNSDIPYPLSTFFSFLFTFVLCSYSYLFEMKVYVTDKQNTVIVMEQTKYPQGRNQRGAGGGHGPLKIFKIALKVRGEFRSFFWFATGAENLKSSIALSQ